MKIGIDFKTALEMPLSEALAFIETEKEMKNPSKSKKYIVKRKK